MPYFLALDAGGTKTDYLLADDTRVLGRVRSGSVKRMRVDAATATANLELALETLVRETGVALRDIAWTCVGTAGETVPLVADWFRHELPARVGGGLLLLGDVEIALDAAFPGGAGVLALAGTGSNVAGRTRGGTVQTAGGWGPALADQGSGHRIGHEALRALFLAQDEGRATTLLAAVLHFWGLSSLEALIAFANAIPSPDCSQLTHVVVRCAEEGDAVAAAVLRAQGEELAYLVRVLLRRLQAASGSEAASVPELAFAGSILENVPPVREALIEAVRREFPSIGVQPGVVDPILGALWRARVAGGCP